MGPNERRWYVEIIQVPTITEARFGYQSAQLGHQVWDCMAWPLSIQNWTESAILAELYGATLDFWSVRR
jgi:hypothetical protein